ncbi:MAG TPA: HD domain-containing protein [Ilumatobacteraceae bacterium]|nr:HD domain-containing protein [Ilumatobacteraceae bacterium]
MEADDPGDITAALAFFMEADLLKGVERQNRLADGSRRENTAEHSWHLGIAALVLAPFASEPVDLGTAVAMALVHDIVEIDAGDTFAYDDAEGAATKVAREEAAADRLFAMLPPATGKRFRELWDEYERGDTPEARFVMAVDRLAPMMLNLAEGATTWREHGITRSRVIARNGRYIEQSLPGAWSFVLAQLNAAVDAGVIDPA